MIISRTKLLVYFLLTIPHIIWYLSHEHYKVNKDIDAFAKLVKKAY